MSNDPAIPLLPMRDSESPPPMISESRRKSEQRSYNPSSTSSSRLTELVSRTTARLETIFVGNVGLALVCSSQLFFAMMNVTVKYFLDSTDIGVWALISVRMFITLIFCIGVMYSWGIPHPFLGPPEIRLQLFFRGFFGFGGLTCMYQSLKGLSVSDSVAIGYLSPSVTLLLGVVLLKESVNKRELVTLVACLIGVTLVSRPPFLFGERFEVPIPTGRLNRPGSITGVITTEQRAVAVTWAFCGVFCSAAAYTTIRFIGNKAHALHSMLYFSYLCCAICIPIMLFVHGEGFLPDSFRSFLLIIIVGIFGFTGQTLLTLGLQREKAGRASLALYTSVVFALIIELIVFHTLPSFLSIIGVTIIVIAAAWVAAGKTTSAPSRTRPADEEADSAPTTALSPSPLPSPALFAYDQPDRARSLLSPAQTSNRDKSGSISSSSAAATNSIRPIRRTISTSSSNSDATASKVSSVSKANNGKGVDQ